MLFWITFLAWLAVCVSFGSAAPVEQSVNSTIVSAWDVYPYSLQIHLLRSSPIQSYKWVIFPGPSGVRVNPCGDNRFEQVYQGDGFGALFDVMRQPIWPARYDEEGRALPFDVRIKYSNHDNCFYHATGSDPDQFRCGNDYIIDFGMSNIFPAQT
ncbi:hypothetical protein PtrSN002B_001213 [Pyrenophora tritici-repentis]|uniref:Uncharacterized protein n=1 Tax=Pyrenophora tritici-repentis TaxID=45151 RepID=A0A2W1EDC4_9PLEO|nr:hypothetical protein PtrV1_00623 [Pyrenophora tritici-repentis]KAF7576399.1 hypothetical protein PtrM4_006390 [Pyrenophora tritici-repentis]KAI0590532.1 hypothetical protein Alg130_02147 [Pyrenophora tritici-repentis]KAI0613609.1 hypothetical protein TUN205_02119 [Pyrenophora tritici-repentis]KAI0625608.1 hypothetical protein TUN199_02368 [Pyrenophora tritici-repentis]